MKKKCVYISRENRYSRLRKILLTMKLSVFLFLFGILSAQGNEIFSQTSLSIHVENASVEEVLEQIQKQCNYDFIYDYEYVKELKAIDVDFKDASLDNVLYEVLKNTNLDYRVEDKMIVLFPRENVIPKQKESISTPVQQQKKVITGQVTDKDGSPLPGVSVVVKGTSNGVATDINGNYSIKVEYKDAFLIFSFVGMTSQEVAYNGQAVQNVILSADSETLGEVVVTGLQTIEKGRATGSFTILKNEDMDNVVSTDFREKLIGAASGVYIDKDNNLMIRGQGTLLGNKKPLIVLDGIPLESSELNLNPNDIDQISVLKDAASASIWGVRAANGVVVITTKRGAKNGKLAVSYSGSYSIEDKVDIGDYHRLNASEYAELEFERSLGKGIFRWSDTDGYNQVQKVWIDYEEQGSISLDEARARIAEIGAFDNESQIEDLFYQRKTVQRHNISLTTGTDKASHYFSVNYDKTDQELVGNSADKINFIGNTDVNLAKGIDLQIGLRGTYQKGNNNGNGSAWEMLPYQRILDEDGAYVDQNHSISENYRDLLDASGFLDWSQNNLRKVRLNDKTKETTNVATSLKLDIELIKGLKFTSFGSYETGRTEGRNLYRSEHDYVRDLKNSYTEVDDTETPEIIACHLPKKGGILDLSFDQTKSFAIRNTLQYSINPDNFRIKFMVGNELYSLKTKYSSNRLFGYDEGTMAHEAIDLASLQEGKFKGYTGKRSYLSYSPELEETLEKYASYFGTANLSYQDKYDLFASVRLDQTNMLVNSSQFRNNPSWSVGGKWHLSQEEFFQSDWINDLAVKVSYGLSGNIEKSTGPDIVGKVDQSYSLSGLNFLSITNPENKELGWEKTNMLNVGVDYSILGGRMYGTFEFYEKRSRDLLSTVNNDATSGWGSVLKNAASVLNRGLDVSLNARILNRIFLWDLGANFSYNYNKVTDINYTPSSGGLYFQSPLKGKAISYIAAIPYAGLDTAGEPQIKKKGDDAILPYTDLNKLTIDDHRFMGRSTPPVFGSLTNTFRYKDLSLGIMITYKLGHKVRMPSPDNSFFDDFTPTEWMSEKYRWTKPGDELTKWAPKLDASPGYASFDRGDAVKYSDYLVDKGDIIRLKSISLEYKLNKLIEKLPVKDASIRLNAENLWYWAANRYNLDTDYLSASGYGSPFSLPVRAKYTVSLKLNL
ncbi:SusC/RagA family TonB-linked outer membrane protein [Labilibaculum sp. A4]|uniref:SusC/RagA family TonB-linked outer membrane protein n=1 Tax=Labilibaculum euxinus TaxID=2686357 RepID=UPI000F625C58|nr:SusC/RagA family TonB-linked outer membrane protein [Labilibaculum euxinus]MDQ1770630.1 SusC/RagA family TonB-linked outer membrane protein [Labilibaculum euxinus]MWN75150.1 SusC/RagA family TonB-linked outer membrane protein [Labilibaculum euxinus]